MGAEQRVPVVTGTLRALRIALICLLTAFRLLPAVLARAAGGSRDLFDTRCGRIISSTLWRLGPAFVKLGQLLSTRQDLLPATLCDELRNGLAHGRDRRTRRRYGDRPAAVMLEIGSVARVRRSWVEGTPVAVKALHPWAARQLELDLALLTLLTRMVMRVLPRSSPPPLPEIVAEMCRSIGRQTDLATEAETLDRLGILAERLPVTLPRVLPEHCRQDRLVMTWLPGQFPAATPRNPRQAARRLVLAVYEMLFVTGVVHCDLHPGNWWELPDGRIAIVDAGFAYELDDDMRRHFAEFFLGMASANPDLCATHALAACARPIPPEREEAFRRDLAELIHDTSGLTAGSFSLARFATRFFLIQRRHRAYSKATFIYPFMALLAIEGQVKQLDPGLNFQALAGPVVLRAIVNRARTGSSDRAAAWSRPPQGRSPAPGGTGRRPDESDGSLPSTPSRPPGTRHGTRALHPDPEAST